MKQSLTFIANNIWKIDETLVFRCAASFSAKIQGKNANRIDDEEYS